MALEIEPSVNAPVAHSLYHAYLLILVLLDPRPIGRTYTMLTPHAIRQAGLRDRAPPAGPLQGHLIKDAADRSPRH